MRCRCRMLVATLWRSMRSTPLFCCVALDRSLAGATASSGPARWQRHRQYRLQTLVVDEGVSRAGLEQTAS